MKFVLISVLLLRWVILSMASPQFGVSERGENLKGNLGVEDTWWWHALNKTSPPWPVESFTTGKPSLEDAWWWKKLNRNRTSSLKTERPIQEEKSTENPLLPGQEEDDDNIGDETDKDKSTELSGSRPCECVMYYLCDRNKEIITTGGVDGLVDYRSLNKKKCSDPLEICCRVPLDPDLVTIPPLLPDTIPPFVPEPTVGRSTTNRPTPITQVGCGVRSRSYFLKSGNRIMSNIRDPETEFGEYPWMLALTKIESSEDGEASFNVFVCGASLIHPRVAITAAHCIDKLDAKDLNVRAGEYDTKNDDEPIPFQTRSISYMIIHPEYTSKFPRSDVALLVLDEEFDLADNVNTICLPLTGDNYVGTQCVANGWGVTTPESTNVDGPGTLKKVILPVITKEECQKMFRKTRLGKYFRLHESFLCAGGDEGHDTCFGDGGGPLACPTPSEPERFVLTGITSWGIGCGRSDIPGAYVDVAHFRQWIDESLEPLDISF